eukprot:jgi/Psemu1/31554/gm1.31554_g
MDMLKNLEIEESSDKMAAASSITQDQKLADLEDYFKTGNMLKSIEEMDDTKGKMYNLHDSLQFKPLEYPFKTLYRVVTVKKIDNTTDDSTEYQQQWEKHDKARNGDCSVSAKSSLYIDTSPHVQCMKKKDGEQKQLIKEMLEKISNLNYCPKGDSIGAEYYLKKFKDRRWKKVLKDDFETYKMYDVIEKMDNEESTRTFFHNLKLIENFDVSVAIRMQVTVTQFCNWEHEGSKMYVIHKNLVKKHNSDDDSTREHHWIDFKHLRAMYHENKWLKEKAVAGDKSVKEMAEEYMDTKPHTHYLSEMMDGEQKQVLEQMLDQILNLKWCLNEGADNYFKQFKTLWKTMLETRANSGLWNIMGTIDKREALRVFFKRHWTCHLAKIDFKDKIKENADEENGDKMDEDNDPMRMKCHLDWHGDLVIQPNPTKSNPIPSDPTRSHPIPLDRIRSHSIPLDPIRSNLIPSDQCDPMDHRGSYIHTNTLVAMRGQAARSFVCYKNCQDARLSKAAKVKKRCKHVCRLQFRPTRRC